MTEQSFPSDWQEQTLGELCDIARGGSPRPIKAFLTDDPEGINWIKIGDATASSKYIYETKERIKPEGIKRSRLVEEGDFLLSNSMSFGRPYIMKTKGCIHDGWLVLRDKFGSFDQDFLYHFLGSNFAYKQFDSLASGSTVRNLNIGLVEKVRVLIPSLPEQKRIVAILDEAFAGIDQAIANTERNLANARELFDSYLNEVFTQKGEGWEECIFGNEIVLQTGFPFKSKRFTEHGMNLLRGDNIMQGYFRWEGVKKWSLDDIADYKDYQLDEGDLVLAMDRTWVKAGIKFAQIDKSDLPCLLVQRVARIKPKSNLNAIFVKFLLGSSFFTNYVLSIQTGTGVPHISGKQIQNFKFAKPGLGEQARLASIFCELSSEVQNLTDNYQRKLEALGELKQSLLQKAFTGELTADWRKQAEKVQL